MNGGLEGMWRDVVMTYFKVSRISGGVEESYKLWNVVLRIAGLRSESVTQELPITKQYVLRAEPTFENNWK
jgi:hypothetical protein